MMTFRDGTTHALFEPLDFIARLAALIPRPRLHLIRYHGLFAPNAKHRHLIVTRESRVSPADNDHATTKPTASMTWMHRLRRVFDIDLRHCPCCGGDLRVIAAITDPALISQILKYRRDARAPPSGSLHDRFLRRLFYDGGNGALVWIYQPALRWTRRYGVLVNRSRYRPVRRVLAKHARRLARRSPTARNRAIFAAQGRRPLEPTHLLQRGWGGIHRRWRRVKSPPPLVAGVQQLLVPIDRFWRAWFGEAGTWAGGVLVHVYGRRTGWFDYRFAGPRFIPRRLVLEVRLSSEYPSRSAPAHGTSRIKVTLDGDLLGHLNAAPDDGLGTWHRLELSDPDKLARLKRGRHQLRFEVVAGPQANGVALYGRETVANKTRPQKEVVQRSGPMRLIAYP